MKLTTEQKKEIKAVYEKWADKALKDCKNMTPEEEKKYIQTNEPKMIEELEKLKIKFGFSTQKK